MKAVTLMGNFDDADVAAIVAVLRRVESAHPDQIFTIFIVDPHKSCAQAHHLMQTTLPEADVVTFPFADAQLIDLGETIKMAVEFVLKGFRESPAGDAYTYAGSMAAVDALREALEAYQRYQIMGDA